MFATTVETQLLNVLNFDCSPQKWSHNAEGTCISLLGTELIKLAWKILKPKKVTKLVTAVVGGKGMQMSLKSTTQRDKVDR